MTTAMMPSDRKFGWTLAAASLLFGAFYHPVLIAVGTALALITLTRAHWLAPLKPKPRIAEEHDSATSLIAAVEAGRGVAIVPQRMDSLAGSRLKIRPLTPAPPPCVVGIAYRKEAHSAATDNFITAAKRAELL